jgi:predicted SAM-dependent methyltransferase
MLKLNLGSGTTLTEGWINIDKSWNIYLSRFPTIKRILFKLGLISEATFRAKWQGKKVLRHDVTKGLPFESGEADFIYCSHLLEHLRYNDAEKVCQEVYRVLKKTGVFRVVVPDLELYARKYIEGDRAFFGESEKPAADLFLDSLYLEGLRYRPTVEKILYDLHKYMYDAESLTFLLRSAGFHNVRICNFREGSCPDLEKIENRTRSVYIEAQK